MKKFALFSLVFCLGIVEAQAANQCKTSITFKAGNNNWNAGSNEYLFETERDYMNAVNTGWYYECDNSDCPNDSYVEVKSNHVFKGRTIHASAKYKCSIGWTGDKWEEVTDVTGLTKCTTKKRWNSDWGVDKLLQNAEANEYLFPTVQDYNALKSLNYTQVYECDSSVCADNTIITLPAGHFFQRHKITKQRKYKCVLGSPGDDKWVDITDDCEDCGGGNNPDPAKKQCKEGGKSYNVGDIIENNKDCTKLSNSLLKTGVKCQKKCYSTPTGVGAVWGITECPKNTTPLKMTNTAASGYTPKFELYTECHKNGGGSVTPPNPNPNPNLQTCEQLHKGNQDAIDCCNAGEIWNKQTNSCDCRDASKVWDATKKQCVAKEVTPVVDGECEYLIKGEIRCANGNYYLEEGWQKVKRSDFEGKQCSEIKQILDSDVNRLIETFKDLCKEKNQNVVILPEGPDPYKVEQAQKTLAAFTERAGDEASVWKTAEGKFNTTRLATDLTAGVVLGTVGGVVTGVVIKKNQVKKGFEALHCTVGGQKVADWGDEFSVGLKR